MKDSERQISVVIPAYNASSWLPETINRISIALKTARVPSAEIIVVDDGSSDNSLEVLKGIKCDYKINILTHKNHENRGRFYTRKVGISAAIHENILLIDTRVYIDKNAIKFVLEQVAENRDKKVWNAHVNVEKKSNIFARFWDAVARVAWRQYFSNPRTTSFGLKDFDKYPKGTTMFYAPKLILLEAITEFEENTTDLKNSNDDTRMIRSIAKDQLIHISPRFACTYHARSNLKQFLKHSFHRGQVFVDGFMRPGNRFFVPLLAFLVTTFFAGVVVVTSPKLMLLSIPLLLVLWILLLAVMLLYKIGTKDTLSLWSLLPLFVLTYGAGIWLAVLRKLRYSPKMKRLLPYVSAIVAYLLYTLFIMRSVVASCSDRLPSFLGDSVGLMWLNSASPNSPWWGFTQWSNFPVGENLWQPTYVVGQLFFMPFWGISKILNSAACSYNVLTSIGFIFSASVMFAFTRWLIGKKFFAVSLFSGFAVAFTPYLQVKTPNNASYVFNGLITLILWLIIANYRKPSVRYSVTVGLIIGSFCYFDPYFLLLGGIMMTAAVLGLMLIDLLYRKKPYKEVWFTKLILVVPVMLVIALPAVIVQFTNSSNINSFVGSSRGDIVADARAFGARPWEYLIPEIHNPLTPDAVKDFQKANYHGSNLIENGLYIGWTVVVLAFIALHHTFFKKNKKENLSFKIPRRDIIIVMSLIVIIAGLVSLPPYFDLLGMKFYFPSYGVIALTAVWRVFSRLVIVLQIGMVSMAAVGFYLLLSAIPRKIYRYLVATMVFTLLFAEFYTHLPTWSFSESQKVYQIVKNDSSINAIAEYPLVDPPQDRYSILYSAYQQIHRKPMINSILPNSKNKPYRDALRNLNYAQTIPILRSMGVNAVIIHSESIIDPGVYTGLEFISTTRDTTSRDSAWLYKIKPGNMTQCILVPSAGFDGPSTTGYNSAQYYMHKVGELKVTDVTGDKNVCEGKKKVMIKFYTYEKNERPVEIRQGEQVVWSGSTKGFEVEQTVNINIEVGKKIEIVPKNPASDYSLVVSDMLVY